MASTGSSLSGSQVKRFEKMKGQATMEGELYEVKLAALLFLRFRNHKKIRHFQLACNVEGAGAMDDLVARYKSEEETWRTVFTQLKHKRTAMLSLESFTMSKLNYFFLKKYFKSARLIEKAMVQDGTDCLFDGSYSDCEFVLYTNAKTDKDIKDKFVDIEDSELRTLLNTGLGDEKVFKISKEKNADIVSCIKGNDDDDVDKFLKATTVFSGQASEGQLDDMIRRELLLACNMTKSEVELFYPYYRDTFKDWWRDSNEILDQESDIIEKAVYSFQIKRLSLEKEKETCLDFKFKYMSLLDLDDSGNVSMIHIVCDRLLKKVACTKLNQTLQKTEDIYTFLSLDTVLQETVAVMSAWRSGAKHTLVVESDSTDDHKDLCKTLLLHLKNDVAKSRIIIISSEDDQFASTLKKSVHGQVQEIHDSFQLTQLEHEDLVRIKSRDMLLQGQKVTLNELVNEDASLFPGVLNDTLLQNILSRGDISLGPKLDDDISYYIPRTLERYDVLNEGVLQEKDLRDVFIVCDISVQDLLMMVPPGNKVGRVGDVPSAECRFLALKSGSNEDVTHVFDRKEIVHLLRMCNDGLLRWIRSKGSINQIIQFIDRRQLTSYNPNTILDLDGRIILVEAQPGMGKSTIVTHLAEVTKAAHSDIWVIRINLSKHTGLLDRSSCLDGTLFLESAVGIDEMSVTEKTLFRHSMTERGNVVVFLDGYDEIAPQFTDKGCVLLTSLSKTKAKKIVVTTRHSMRNKLEGHMSTIAFTLRRFSEDNQREFFVRYWNKDDKGILLESDDVKELLNQLLKHISQSINDKTNEFLGIPLHAMMLAEIYEDFFKNPGAEVIPDKLDLLTLFEKVIDKKFHIYLCKKFPDNKNIAHEIKELLKPVYKDHMNAALVLLLHDSELRRLNKAREIIEKTKKFSKKIEDSKNKTGIVDRVLGGKLIFVHRTFAEYFAARWFSKNFKENQQFLRDHMFKDEFKVIRSMFDLFLSRRSELHTAVLYNNILNVTSLLASGEDVNTTDNGGRSPVHLAAALGFDCQNISPVKKKMAEDHVIKHLLQHGADVNVLDEVLEWSGIEYAVNTKSWDAVELILEVHPESSISALIKKNVWSILRVEFNEWRYLNSTLVHQAAAFGYILILKVFLSLPCDFHSEVDANRATALHEACIWNNVSVARVLIAGVGGNGDDVRSYVNTRDKNGWSALHYISVSGESLTDCRNSVIEKLRGKFEEGKRKQKSKETESGEKSNSSHGAADGEYGTDIRTGYTCKVDVDEIIKLLVDNGGDIWACDEKQRTTPLHLACVLGEVNVARALIGCLEDDPTLNENTGLLKYINHKAKDGRCALHCAAEGGSAEVVRLLIDKGGDVLSRDDMNTTPLHYASWLCKASAVEALTERLAGDKEVLSLYVNTPDSLPGWHPLHYAAFGGSADIVRELLKMGADPRATGTTGASPLVVAVKEHKLDVVRALIESLGDDCDVATYINTPDSYGKTAVHACAQVYALLSCDVMRFLLARGGIVWLRDAAGSTPLHIASAGVHVHVVRVIVESLGDDRESVRRYVNLQDKAGRTAMHHAARDPRSGVIQYLITKGGDIWIRDNEDRSLYSMVTLKDLLYTGSS